jgi:protein SCO1/2
MVETETTTAPGTGRAVRPIDVAAIMIVLVLGAMFGWYVFRPHPYAGTVLQSPTRAPALDGLVFHDGEPADLSQFDGDLVLLYFGYTNCPDVCPLTLSTAARARESLGDDAERVHVVMVTVDPARDTAEALGDYVTYFDPGFLGALGPDRDLRSAAVMYSVYVSVEDTGSEAGYLVEHTASLMAIDSDGYLRVLYPPEVGVDALAADLEELLG